jgi:hypothetical protein
VTLTVRDVYGQTQTISHPLTIGCAQPLGLFLKDITIASNQFQAMITGLCEGLVDEGVRVAYVVETANLQLGGVETHSPSCTEPLPTATLHCVLKTDGRICTYLTGFERDIQPGDKIGIVIEREDGTVLKELHATVPSQQTSQPACQVGD